MGERNVHRACAVMESQMRGCLPVAMLLTQVSFVQVFREDSRVSLI